MAQVEPTENAALAWLSSLTHPWLLLVDQTETSVVSLDYPLGEHGLIIQATRVPMRTLYGGYRLKNMDATEAVDLLLSIVYPSYTWTPFAEMSASNIATHLNYVPLAIVAAGRTIVTGVCTLDGFISFHETQLMGLGEEMAPNSTEYRSLCAVYESLAAMETSGSKDAIQVLRIISLYDRVGIENLLSDDVFIDWSTKEHGKTRQLRNPLQSPILPVRSQITPEAVLRNIKASIPIDEENVRAALRELRRLLFITFDEASETYAIIPLARSCLYEKDVHWDPPFSWYDTGGYTWRMERRGAIVDGRLPTSVYFATE
jgi:hypothetical protein